MASRMQVSKKKQHKKKHTKMASRMQGGKNKQTEKHTYFDQESLMDAEWQKKQTEKRKNVNQERQ